MRFAVLGALEVLDDRGVRVAVAGPRPRALLVLLALDAGRPVPVERIVDGQYGANPPAGAANAVQAQVSRLRRALGGEVVTLEPGGYRLAAEPADVDALRFEQLAAHGRRLLGAGRTGDALRVLDEALALWRGPALADLPDPGAAGARLDGLRLAAEEDRAEAALTSPDGPSIPRLQELVAAHPLRERLRGLLMRALLADGRPAEALTEFERVRRRLRTELGTDPSPELAAVHTAVLRAERPPAARRARPPTPLTELIGRDAELARLAAHRDARLVTILGPGGAGKTRLALDWARGADREACFVDLAAVVDPDAVPRAVLHAVGVRDATPEPVEQLVTALDGADLLLLLDNCEQVVGAVAALLGALLRASRSVFVVATSREPLGLTGEVLVPLGPLPEAVDLFARRAAAVRPGFVVDATTRPVVETICAALDGLPLAVELAAARLRQLPLDAVAARLAGPGRFRLLSRGDPTADPRHRTLAGVVAWSWALLRPDEERLARRFAVFADGAPAEAVEAVCGPGSAEVLADLVDRSLVTTDEHRHRMPETIRLYGLQRLAESGEEPQLRAAHARAHLALAQEADPHLRRAAQLDWLARLRAEHANLDAALRWSADHDRRIAFALVAALSAYWWFSGCRSESGDVAAQLLEAEPPAGMDEEYVACVAHALPTAAPQHWERAAAIVRDLDRSLRYPFGAAMWGMAAGPLRDGEVGNARMLAADPWNDALLHLSSALLATLGGAPADAEKQMRATLVEFRQLGDRWGWAQALDWLALLDSWRGRHTAAHEGWSEALAKQAELGALEECADVLTHRAQAWLRRGDLDAAAADLAAADAARRAAGQPRPIAAVRIGQAEIARRRGDLDTAAALLDQLDRTEAAVRTALGKLATARGENARPHHRDALVAAREALRSDLADAVEGAAEALPAARAARVLGVGAALRGVTLADDRDVRAELGDAAFAEAFAAGAMLDADAALTVVDETVAWLSVD